MSVPLRKPLKCELCFEQAPALRRPKTGQKVCKECFFAAFEREVHETIVQNNLFYRGERVAVGASGGKDSTVLAAVLKTLNERYDYGIELILLSVDEGITGYRDDSLKTVKRNAGQYGMDLTVVSYADLYGWTMDEIVARIGKRNNCTYCGVFRRQALDRGCAHLNIHHVVTGHNADDMAETVLMNMLRGDTARLARCTDIVTGSDSESGSSSASEKGMESSIDTFIKRSKPLKYCYEKEIVLYAHYKKLDYFSTECTYSPEAFRGTARALIKNLEAVRPSAIIDVIHSGEQFVLHQRTKARQPQARPCTVCGYISSNSVCKACVLLRGLNASRAQMPIEFGADG